jgi:cellulose synthase/poly-beta-1,6-N-acetylglucosamine synthase-like glycosyltransferase
VDADSLLEADALMRASKLFVEDRTVVATGGIVRVLNGCAISQGKVVDVLAPKRMIECFQSVEYIRGFLVGRTFWNCANSMLIVSGAFGIFRKDILIAIDGYRKTVGEDIDVVVRMHRHCIDRKIPHRIVFVPDPVCWTQVPVDYVSLLKQRNRWHRGLIDCLRYNRGMIFNPKYGYVGMVALPYYVLVEALGPLVEITGYASFVVCYFLGMANREMALIFIVLAVVWGMSLNVGAILLDNLIYRRYRRLKDLVKVSSFAFTEYLGYRQLVVVERLIATLTFFRRHWDQPTRKTMVSDE